MKKIIIIASNGDRFKFLNVTELGEWADNKIHIKFQDMDTKEDKTATFYNTLGWFEL